MTEQTEYQIKLLKRVEELLLERDSLNIRLVKVNENIANALAIIKGVENGKIAKHPKRKTNNEVNHYLTKVMAPGAEMTAPQIFQRMQLEGFKTNNESFVSYLQQNYLKRKDIKKVRRGVYKRVPSLEQKGQ